MTSKLNRFMSPTAEEVAAEGYKWTQRVADLRAKRENPELIWFGQPNVMAQIAPFMEGEEAFPHTILLGEPGLGKTHLARWIAAKRKEPFEELLAPVNMTDLPRIGIVLIDEVHRQTKPEPLFKIMAEDVPTVMAATTRPEVVDKAFKSRFFLELHLRPYSTEAMRKLIEGTLGSMGGHLDMLSTAAAGNPRQANRIAEVARRLNTTNPDRILEAARVTVDGLTEMHLVYLETLKQYVKPVGLTNLAAAMYSDEGSVRDLDRLLVKLQLVVLQPNGRLLTQLGHDYANG